MENLNNDTLNKILGEVKSELNELGIKSELALSIGNKKILLSEVEAQLAKELADTHAQLVGLARSFHKVFDALVRKNILEKDFFDKFEPTKPAVSNPQVKRGWDYDAEAGMLMERIKSHDPQKAWLDTAQKMVDSKPPVEIQELEIDYLLTPKAHKLFHLTIRSLLNQYTVDSVERTTPCQFAEKLVPLMDGKVPEEYLKRWANMLNFLAERDIWEHGSLGHGIMPVATIDGSPPVEARIFSYFHVGDTYADIVLLPGEKPNEISCATQDARLTAAIGWDVLVLEGQAGNSNWDNCPF